MYNMTLNSQHGPYQFAVRHRPDGTMELWLPRMQEPHLIPKDNAIWVTLNVPGPPVPVELIANWEKPNDQR